MALRRMFHKDIVLSDRFISMSTRCQALYFQLCMNADDEGFVGGAYRIARSVNARRCDLEKLKDEEYIYIFPSGVAYIEHWKKHNRIQRSRLNPTAFLEEKSFLGDKVKDPEVLEEEKLMKAIIRNY